MRGLGTGGRRARGGSGCVAGAMLLLSCARPSSIVVAPPAVARVMSTPKEVLFGPCAVGALGDIRMENGELLAVISQRARSNGFATSPGNLVDLTPLPEGQDHLNEVFLYINDDFPRQAHYTKTEIISSGGGRSPAVVRAVGVDSKDARIKVETEYKLEPATRWLTITSRFTSTATTTLRNYRIGDAIQWGRTQSMAPGHGFNLSGRRVHVDWIAGIGDGTSYALVPDGQRRFDTPSGSMWSDPIGATVDLPPKKPVIYVRHIVVGNGDTASLAGAIAKLRGDRTGRLSGRVMHGRDPVADALVRIFDESGEIAGLALVERTGAYAIDLAPGRYRALATAPGRTPTGPSDESDRMLEIQAGSARSADFSLGARATISWRIEGDDGRETPVKVTVTGESGTPTPDFGPIFRADGASKYVLSANGAGEVAIGPGRYKIMISRGPEYDVIERSVTAVAGQDTKIGGRLVRSVATPGFLSTDLHQHAAPSFDSGVSLADRALSNAAEGVEVLVSTDHNVLTDYAPVIRNLGLGRVVASIVGVEATTHSVGHFNGMPLTVASGQLRGGMVNPEGMTPRRIVELLRSLAHPGIEPFIQANHPRSGKKTGYFDLMGFDSTTGLAADEDFVPDLDGVEVVTFGHEDETKRVLSDWFALLRTGRHITATGASDSHTISLREVGWPRTYVCMSDDEPARLDVKAFIEALKRGCATVSAGPFVTIKSGDATMGDTLSASGGRFEVSVEVQAPSWVSTETLTLFVDGVPARTIPLEDSGVRRYGGQSALACRSDCFVIAMVESKKELPTILDRSDGRRPTPIGLTNPIYVDVDGDGRFAPRRERQP